MKSKITLMLFFVGIIASKNSFFSQSSLTIDGSQILSNFKFDDSQGTRDKVYNPIYTSAYSVGYRYATESGLMFRAALGMRKAGATMVYDAVNYAWNLQYADVKIGLGYVYNKPERIHPYLSVSGYFAYLLKANQSINNENFDVLKSESINKMDYGVFITPGINIKINDNMSAYTEFNYMMGLANLETSTDGQKSNNAGMSLSLGLSFTISK